MLKVGSAFNPFGLFTGIWIPNCIAKLPPDEISSSQKLILGRLYQYGGKNGRCYPKQDTLAQEVGLSNSVVRDCLNKLVEKGFIKKIPPTGVERLQHKHNQYIFLIHSCMLEMENEEEDQEDDPSTSGPEQSRCSGAPESRRCSERRNPGGPIKVESYKENPKKERNKKGALVDKEKDRILPVQRKRKTNLPPYEEIKNLWNEITAPKLSQVFGLSSSRKNKIAKRWSEIPDIEKWRVLFHKIMESDFLTGDSDRGWKCSLDWIIANDTNYLKVMEGVYANVKGNGNGKRGKEKLPQGKFLKRGGGVFSLPPDHSIN